MHIAAVLIIMPHLKEIDRVQAKITDVFFSFSFTLLLLLLLFVRFSVAEFLLWLMKSLKFSYLPLIWIGRDKMRLIE